MKRTRIFSLALATLWLCSFVIAADSYEELDFKDLKKAKEDVDGKAVVLKVGLGELDSGSFELDDKGIAADKYTAVRLYRPGKTKEYFNAYLLKDSPVLRMYKNYGTGEQLEKTQQQDRAVTVGVGDRLGVLLDRTGEGV